MKHVRFNFLLTLALLLTPAAAIAQSPCPRFAPGSVVKNPPALFSQHGTLMVNLDFHTTTDAQGRTLYCFTAPDGSEGPTLHINPGDHLMITVKNDLPTPTSASDMQMATNANTVCGDTTMNESSVNIHYHGTNTSPTCHQDEVIHTLINSGETFTYDVAFPIDEPPGLYWYHPHVHGIAERTTLGGASGALIVDGAETIQPAVRGLPQRVFVIRDQSVAGDPEPGGPVPAKDVTINYVAIPYPALTPAVIDIAPNEKQLWRVTNASADNILDLQIVYDGKPQPIQLVALDGVPVGSQDGTAQGKLVTVTDLRLPTAARMEFIVTGPPKNVKSAQFETLKINTGPDGDNDTQRVIANIKPVGDNSGPDGRVSPKMSKPWRQRFEGLADARVTAKRALYFSENDQDQFFITVDGATPVVFSPDNPPAIQTTQGSVEDWTIQNRSLENHEFHIHQIHFMVMSQDNFQENGSQPIKALQGQLLDMIDIPFWDGNPHHKYPSVTVRLDFRGQDIGDFVYHCHILEHEDHGMMAIIRVNPGPAAKGAPKTRNIPAKTAHRESGVVKVASIREGASVK